VKLKRLEIHNYKSLRNVVIEPAPLTVFVGPNAAGKSNLADALDFLSEVYRWNLEGAVKKKGGYENICFRQGERSAETIRFRVVLESEKKSRRARGGGTTTVPLTGLLFDHTFELGPRFNGARDSFYVPFEDLSVSSLTGSAGELVVRLVRSGEKYEAELPAHGREDIKNAVMKPAELDSLMPEFVRSGNLFFEAVDLFFPWISKFSKELAALRVFQLSPRYCRQGGVPTPNADMDRFGGNLPAVIDYLKNNEPDAFEQLLVAVRRIMPSMESFDAGFTYTKTLGLFLKEAGIGNTWTAEDISDGTIQAIALLTATFDRRIPLLVIEEPENSVHPWAIRNFVEAFRAASKQKQIFVTTHSPILIDQIRPEELWVVQRPELETKITPVLELDPPLKEAWSQGKFTLSEYLDSGAVPQAVPAVGE
jgi:predicted ATPase